MQQGRNSDGQLESEMAQGGPVWLFSQLSLRHHLILLGFLSVCFLVCCALPRDPDVLSHPDSVGEQCASISKTEQLHKSAAKHFC